ncbi:MAG: nucleotidyltransferase domain-containing protein [Campylobacterales bacterium]|nr:nucleotidyltransferase domain-containing protein [Campylobacterales bacterium]
MKKQEILATLKTLQLKYRQEGVELLGLFGSYARDEQNDASDIDILIETTPAFLKKHLGFRAFTKLDSIKSDLRSIFNKPVDLVDKKALEQHHNTHILKSTLYVS